MGRVNAEARHGTVDALRDCEACGATGRQDGETCEICAGRGQLTPVEELLGAIYDMGLDEEQLLRGVPDDEEASFTMEAGFWRRLQSAASRCGVA